MTNLDKILEEMDNYRELYNFVCEEYWSRYWPSKQDVKIKAIEELIEELYKQNEFEQFGFSYNE